MTNAFRRISVSTLTETSLYTLHNFSEALNALVKAHGRAVWEYLESDGVNEFSVNFLAQ